jgi:hypothetical protein
VTFAATITTLSDRFLSERAFELIVAPALADFDYDAGGPAGAPQGEHRAATSAVARHAAVLSAFAGAIWDDAVRGNLWTFAGLVLIPACYYFFFFLLGLAGGPNRVPASLMTTLALTVLTLSLAPAIVCFWPERPAPKTPAEP